MKDICFQKAAQQEIQIYYPKFNVKTHGDSSLNISIESSERQLQNRWKIKNEKGVNMQKPK